MRSCHSSYQNLNVLDPKFRILSQKTPSLNQDHFSSKVNVSGLQKEFAPPFIDSLFLVCNYIISPITLHNDGSL